MALFNNIFSQSGYAPPPNFNFGPSTANCGPCGSNPVNTLPEQPPAPTPGNPDPCNPTQIPPQFNPQPIGQPVIPTNPLGPWQSSGGNPLNPSGPQHGIIWPGPQPGPLGGGHVGIGPTPPNQPILWNPKPYHPTTIPQPPDKYIPPQHQIPVTPLPNPWTPSCGMTSGPQMDGLPVVPSVYQGWNVNGTPNMVYQNMQGTGQQAPLWALVSYRAIPTIPGSPPSMFGSGFKRPFFLPSEIPPQLVAGCNYCIV